jgi:hypothetical protein
MGISDTIQKIKNKFREGKTTKYIELKDLDGVKSTPYEAPTIRERIEGTKKFFKQKIAERKLYNKEKLIEQAAKEEQEIKDLKRKTTLTKAQTAYDKLQPPRPQFGRPLFSGGKPNIGGPTNYQESIEKTIPKKKGGNVFGGDSDPFGKNSL